MKGRAQGVGLFRAVIWLLILLLFVYAAQKILPAYMAEYRLEDGMRSEARFAGAERQPREKVREDIHRMALQLGIPATLDDIRVDMIEGGIRISVDYTVQIDFFRYQFRLQFHPTADSNSI
jgi:hypothetical protein